MSRLNHASRPETVATIDIGTGFFNHYGGDVDSAGRPHYVLYKWDESHRTQVWHLQRGVERWELNQVSRYEQDLPWNRHQVNGLAATALARPELVIDRDDGRVIILTRSQHHGNQLEVYRARLPYRRWELDIVATGSLGGWEPQLDKDLFHRRKRLVLLVNVVRDAPAYAGYDQRLTPQQLAVLDERAAGEEVAYPDYSILFPITPPPLSMQDIQFADGEAWIAALRIAP